MDKNLKYYKYYYESNNNIEKILQIKQQLNL
jgi:hypothetical protein